MGALRFAALGIFVLALGSAQAGEAFRHLSASEIRARFVGKECTDEVHWAYRVEPSGRLHIVSLGRTRDGRWRIDGTALCLADDPCLQVWIAGDRVELRGDDGSLPIEGVLKKPARRI